MKKNTFIPPVPIGLDLSDKKQVSDYLANFSREEQAAFKLHHIILAKQSHVETENPVGIAENQRRARRWFWQKFVPGLLITAGLITYAILHVMHKINF
jgi:hypothetical protein